MAIIYVRQTLRQPMTVQRQSMKIYCMEYTYEDMNVTRLLAGKRLRRSKMS